MANPLRAVPIAIPNLHRLMMEYSIPNDIELRIPNKEKPELQVKTALADASSYRDLLSINNLVNYHLVSDTSKDMSSILEYMKKCVHPSSSSAPPKRSRSSKVVSHI
ncbi:hypothetical protein WN943_027702 [Citrus x changshan-huyou]